MSDNLTIIKDGLIYVLPTTWAISDSGAYSFNAKFVDNAYSHGSSVEGDKMVDGRNIKIDFEILADSATEHDEVVNEAYKYFAGTDYILKAGREDREYRIACLSKIAHKWKTGFKQRYSEVTVTLMLADPFRYATEPLTVTQLLTNEETVTINNIGSVVSPLIIKIAPTGTADDIEIIHNNKDSMTLNDSTLSLPATCTISSVDGTVYRGKSNNINTFDGSFLQIDPGVNSYQYFGDEALVTFTFTPRWFI